MRVSTKKNKQLSDFLRHKRASITPDMVGLTATSTNRRTCGLRREEVAVLANVSLTWYTWLEQGKEVQASASVLSSIARALQLNEAEIRYVFELAGYKYTASDIISNDSLRQIQDLLNSITERPAYCVDRYWTVCAINHLAADIFDVHVGTNCIEDFFSNPKNEHRYPSFNSTASMLVTQFRQQAAIFYDDPQFHDMANRLGELSPDFRTLWENHTVNAQPYLDLTYDHPTRGRLFFTPCVLNPYGNVELRIFYYIPRNEIADV